MAYTSSGSLYAGVSDPIRKGVLSVLDRESGKWKPVADVEYVGQWRLLLGSDRDDLVFKSNSGTTELLWSHLPDSSDDQTRTNQLRRYIQ
jgi:hypothetical protein